MKKALSVLLLCLFAFNGALSSNAYSGQSLTDSERSIIRQLIENSSETPENKLFKANFELLLNSCDLYKSEVNKISEELRTLKPGEHPLDLYTLPSAFVTLKKTYNPFRGISYMYDDFLPGEPFLFDDVPYVNRTLFSVRIMRERLTSCFGVHGLQTLDSELKIPARTVFFIKYGRDGNALSSGDVDALTKLSKSPINIDVSRSRDSDLEVLEDCFYNYRAHAKAVVSGAVIADSKRSVPEAIQPREFMMLNLRIDRDYFLTCYGDAGLAAIDEYLKIPKAIRNELANFPKLYSGQSDLLVNKKEFECALKNLLDIGKSQRSELWTKQVASEEELRSLFTQYLVKLAEAASISQDTYVMYSQPNWPEHLKNDLDANRLPPKSESALNAALQIRWKLEGFSNADIVAKLNAKQRFVYSDDATLRPSYLPFYQKRKDYKGYMY